MNDEDIIKDEVAKDIYASKSSLAKWDNVPSVRDLKQDLEDAKSAHNAQVSQVSTWLDNLNVTGSARVNTKKGRSKIVPKLIRKQAEWRYSSLSEPFLSTEDVFNVEPITFEDKPGAFQNQLILNNQFNTKLDKVKFIDDYVRTAVDEGTVIVRVGWDYEDETVEVEVPVFEYVTTQDPAVAQQHQQIHALMQQNIGEYNNLPAELRTAHEILMESGELVVPQLVGTEVREETNVLRNQPTVSVCDYRNVIIDPTCEGDLTKASFIVYSFETSLSELKKDGKYSNLDQIKVSNASVLSEPDHASHDDSAFSFKDKPRQKFVAYEYWGYWDIDNTGIVKPIVATFVGDTIIRMEENPFPDQKLPFVLVQYLPKRKSIYGEPDGALLEDNQKIAGAVTRGMIDIMGRSANGQMAVRKDALDLTNKRKFDQGMDYEFNANVDPRQAFHMHTYPEIPQSAQFMLQLQNQEAESLTGVKAFTTGISGQSLGNTATGIRSALDATSKRELAILRRLAEGIKEIGRKIIAMNAVFLSDTEVVRVTNAQFVEVRRDDLAGNYDLRLSISTAEADNEKAQELAFMLQTMGNSMDPNMSRMILADIASLRKMPELAKQIKEYQPQPDPLAQRRAELELALLEAQVMNERAKGQENAVDVQLKTAKTQVELAKTRNLESRSDQQDLDFVQKQTGQDIERELAKKDFDRKSQLDLKAADSMLMGNEQP